MTLACPIPDALGVLVLATLALVILGAWLKWMVP